MQSLSVRGWLAIIPLDRPASACSGLATAAPSKAAVTSAAPGASLQVTTAAACVGDEPIYAELAQAGTTVTGQSCEYYLAGSGCYPIENGSLTGETTAPSTTRSRPDRVDASLTPIDRRSDRFRGDVCEHQVLLRRRRHAASTSLTTSKTSARPATPLPLHLELHARAGGLRQSPGHSLHRRWPCQIMQWVIAGGGPTGMMLAGELALAGVDVAIVERRATQDPRRAARAGGLHSRTIEGAIDQRDGIAERFLSQGKAMQVARLRDRSRLRHQRLSDRATITGWRCWRGPRSSASSPGWVDRAGGPRSHIARSRCTGFCPGRRRRRRRASPHAGDLRPRRPAALRCGRSTWSDATADHRSLVPQKKPASTSRVGDPLTSAI